MGTSSIFNGRNDKNRLLPDDYNDLEQNSDVAQKPSVTWQTVKTDMSKYLTSGGNHGSARHIMKQYVKASGGARRMAAQSTSGLKAGGNIGSLFNSIRTEGYEKTFQRLGIQYSGRSIHEIFSELTNSLAPASDTKEDIIAKQAVQAALTIVYDYIEENDMDISSLDAMAPAMMNEVLADYVGSYIWISMMKDLGSRLEKYIDESDKAYETECEFKDMIMGIVKVEFSNKGNIVNQSVPNAIAELYERCLEVMEEIV